MNKATELTAIVGAIIALACAVIVMVAITGTMTAATWDIFQGFVAVMIAIFIIGVILIANETKKEKQIDYMLKKASTV